MSGYLRRLIARSTGTASDIRPLSTQPYAALSQTKLQDGKSDQFVIGSHHAANLAEETKSDLSDRDKKMTTKVTGTADMANKTSINGPNDSPILTQPASESTVASAKSLTPKVSAQAKLESLFDSVHEMSSQHLSQKGAESSLLPSWQQSISARHEEKAASLNRKADQSSTEEFNLMPLQSHSLSRKQAPSSTITPFPPFSSLRDQKGVSSIDNVYASEAYRHHANAPEAATTVHVSIGRIEIRATASPAPNRKTSVRSPAMSLDEYLRKRNGGQR